MYRGRRESRAFQRMAGVFKRMVHDACDRTGDTEGEIAEECLLGHKSFLNNMANGHAPLPCDVLIRFTRRYHDRRGVEELLRLVEMDGPAPSATTVFDGLLESQREALEYHGQVLEALQDGHVDASECEALERELTELITSSKDLLALCKGMRRDRRDAE